MMCEEKRQTVVVTKMDDEEERFSINASTMSFYKTLIAIIVGGLAVTGVLFSVSYSVMVNIGERHFQERLAKALSRTEAGSINLAIEREIAIGNLSIERRLIRIETILLEMREDN